MSCALQRCNKLSLMFCTRAGNALRNDLALLCRETLQALFIFVVDVVFFCVAEFAGALLARHLSFFFATRFTWTVKHGILLYKPCG